MKKAIKRILLVIFILCIISGAAAAGMITVRGYAMYQDALASKSLEEAISEIQEKESYITIDEIPKIYLDAVISVEDKRFYSHGGVDMISIGRAVIHDIKAMALVEGGSTITQQLAKNLYFSLEKRFERKAAEVFMAFDIEKLCSKDEILELYLNTIYYGDGYYCIGDAAEGYFGKKPSEMNDYECILLAGIPNAPSAYSPTKNPELAAQRQRQVLVKMIECGKITEAYAEEIANKK